MITIQINRKPIDIKTFNDLTVKEYLQVKTKIENKKDFNLIDYLSIVTDTRYSVIRDLKINPIKLQAITNSLGQLQDYTKIPPGKKLIINDRYYFKNNMTLDTLGARFMIEENAKQLEGEQLLCFILATAITGGKSFTETNNMYSKLLNTNYIEVLPMAFFLAKNLRNGKRGVMSYLVRLGNSIKTMQLRSRLVLTTFNNTVTIWKWRLSQALQA